MWHFVVEEETDKKKEAGENDFLCRNWKYLKRVFEAPEPESGQRKELNRRTDGTAEERKAAH